MQGWYAPSLHDAREAGLADWSLQDIARLLQTGVTERGRASGPMAEVVLHGTQSLSDADAAAMASYLKALPQTPVAAPPAGLAPHSPSRMALAGAKIYDQQCAQCHERYDSFIVHNCVLMNDSINYSAASSGKSVNVGVANDTTRQLSV